jgi:hypothetical protein
MLLTILVPEYIMGRALSERLAAASTLESLKSRFGEEMEIVHAYVMNMGGYFLDYSEVGFTGLDISKIVPTRSSGFSTTAVDYSGVHFSPNHIELSSKKESTERVNKKVTGDKDISIMAKTFEHPSTNCPLTAKTTAEELQVPQDLHQHNVTKLEESPCFQGIPELKSLKSSSTKSHSQSTSPQAASSSMEPTSPGLPVRLSSFQTLNLAHLQHKRWTLTALQILRAKGFGLFESLPEVPPQQLEALSKSDALVTILAILQMAWLMIQLLVRYKQNIESSQLEIVTLAFSACGILTYAILWDRPRGVTTRYRIQASRGAKVDEVLLLATFGPGYLWTWPRLQSTEDIEFNLMPIPNDASHAVDVRNLAKNYEGNKFTRAFVDWGRHYHPAVVSVVIGSILGGTLFGGLHCLAWNFIFPTHIEVTLWRICSVATTLLPILSMYFSLQWLRYNGWAESEHSTAQRLHGLTLLLCFILPYILARSFLLIEAFRSLFYLPTEAFIDTWPGTFLLWN